MYYFHGQRIYNGMSYLAKDGKVYKITRSRGAIAATVEGTTEDKKLYSVLEWWDDFICWVIRPSSNEGHYLPDSREQAKEYAHAEALFEDTLRSYTAGRSDANAFMKALDAFTSVKMGMAWSRGHAEGYERGVEDGHNEATR